IGTLPQREGMAKEKEYARRAIALDDSSAEGHASMAIAILFGDWNWAEAEREVNRALQINPGYSTAHLVKAVILTTAGRIEEALQENRKALDLDPLSLIVNWNDAVTLFYAKRYQDALAQAERTVKLDPLSPLPHGVLARTYEETGQYEKGIEVLGRHMPLGVHEERRGIIATLRQAYAREGPAGYWRAALASALAGDPRSPRDKMRVATIYVKLGDRDKALTYLERAVAEHSGDMIFLGVEPCFDPIRDDPRFKALIRRIGFPTRA